MEFHPRRFVFVCEICGKVQFGGRLIILHLSGEIIATSAEVTLNGGLVRESPPNPLNSGLGIIVICPDLYIMTKY